MNTCRACTAGAYQELPDSQLVCWEVQVNGFWTPLRAMVPTFKCTFCGHLTTDHRAAEITQAVEQATRNSRNANTEEPS